MAQKLLKGKGKKRVAPGGTRHCFSAAFAGKMTQAEFLAAYPSYAKLGPSRQKAYYVFATKPVDYPAELGSQIVLPCLAA